jgi:predicted metal-binding membrane protein
MRDAAKGRCAWRAWGSGGIAVDRIGGWNMSTADQQAEHTGVAGMSGTMGLGLPAFVGMWALMMAAMMLPSVAPVASMYQRSVRSCRALRLAGFTSGYLPAGAGIPAFLLTAFVAQLVDDHPAWATAVAVAVFASCGVYQLTR